MKWRKKRRKLNNKGLTLIEMVVAIAIIGIFSGVVLTFITSGANFYRKVSITTKLQSDMQTTLESIENAIMDTNMKIMYTSDGISIESDMDSTASVKKKLTLERKDPTADEDVKQYLLTIFEWNPSEQKLYYNNGYEKNGAITESATARAVLAENVSGFQVDISKAKSEGVVLFRLTLKKGDKEISQLYTVTLRNKVEI